MPFDVQFALNVMYPAAVAAYAIIDNPNPSMPDGYNLVGPIRADPSRAQADVAAANDQQQSMVHEMLADSYNFGIVAWNAAAGTALVAFRGTQTLADWLDDFDAVALPYKAVPGAGFVHLGFQLVYEHVRGSLPALILNGCPGCKRVLVTGHSLGGALAVLSALDLATNIPPRIVPELYTFAGPRTGAPDFAAAFNAHISTCYRVVNVIELTPLDIVPNVPLPPLYEHVGSSVTVHGGFTLDEKAAHALTSYAIGLRRLQPVAATATPG
ncbi:MAG: lipase family protein [Bryobacteraceae bacterium]